MCVCVQRSCSGSSRRSKSMARRSSTRAKRSRYTSRRSSVRVTSTSTSLPAALTTTFRAHLPIRFVLTMTLLFLVFSVHRARSALPTHPLSPHCALQGMSFHSATPLCVCEFARVDGCTRPEHTHTLVRCSFSHSTRSLFIL